MTLTFSNVGGSTTTDANGSFHHAVSTAGAAPSPRRKTATPSVLPRPTSPLSRRIPPAAFTAGLLPSSIKQAPAEQGDSSLGRHLYRPLLRPHLHASLHEVAGCRRTYKPTVRPTAFLLPPGGRLRASRVRNPSAPTLPLRQPNHPLWRFGHDKLASTTPFKSSYRTRLHSDGFTIRDGNASENYSDDRGKGGDSGEGRLHRQQLCLHRQPRPAIPEPSTSKKQRYLQFLPSPATPPAPRPGGAIDANASRLTLLLLFISNVSQHSAAPSTA